MAALLCCCCCCHVLLRRRRCGAVTLMTYHYCADYEVRRGDELVAPCSRRDVTLLLLCHAVDDHVVSFNAVQRASVTSTPLNSPGKCTNLLSHGFVFGPERPVPESHSSCCSCSCCCCYKFSKSPKISKAFLIRSGAQRNSTYTFVLTFTTDLPCQIFHLFSN